MSTPAEPAKKFRAGLVGVTGYTGMELARIAATHPNIELVCVTSRSDAGKKVEELYPFLQDITLGQVVISQPDPDELAQKCDVVFLAVPHGTAMEMAGTLRRKNLKVIDLSADFRIHDAQVYKEWYGAEHTEKNCLEEAVYGLPELYADRIKNANMIANPGCYPTASILALYPALSKGYASSSGIIIDAKSGTSGAGRKASIPTLFVEVQDSFRPYGVPRHRHIPEIEQELTSISGQDITISFTPHLLPINRGILATVYAQATKPTSTNELYDIYTEHYAKHNFVRVLSPGKMPELRFVRGTMFCDISLVYDSRTNRIIAFSAIDNLCRGASGQAIANANLMLGLPLETGLQFAPLAP